MGFRKARTALLLVLSLIVVLSMCLPAQDDQGLYSPGGAIAVQISPTLERTNESAYACAYVCGDANGSGEVSISDVVFIINYVFSGGDAPDPVEAGDVNRDGVCNISDAVFLVNYVFGGGPAPVACPYSINIVDLQPGDNTVNGTAIVLDTSKTKVVLWAKTDRWYVQPSVAEPYTVIQGNGTWSSSTYPWNRIVALLVDSSYVPGSIRDDHPSLDLGVIRWDEYPGKSLKYINWSDYCWRIKRANLVDPGPNYFSDDSANVQIDREGRLHLRIDFRDNKWYCAELVLDRSLGYGIYSFKLESRVDNLDFNTILGCFIYETINQEFDIEFSQRLAAPFNAQYVAQPWYVPGNIEFFNMSSGSQTSHSFEWRSDRIVFTSWNGHSNTPAPNTLINTWTYTGDNIVIPGGERMIFNLYLYGGEPPLQGIGDEVIITSFEFTN